MSNYVQATNFATKDALPSGDPLKIVRGTEINTEFNNIATAVATKADTNSPTLATPTLVNPALGTPVSGNLANCTFPTLNQNTTGNAGTATALQNARNIGGVSFNGTANINLPGVNTAGNQNTSGNAATATNASTVTTVTTNQVLGATAGANHQDIGSMTIAWNTSTSDVAANGNIAGSSLRFASGLGSIFTFKGSFNPSFPTANTTALTGTWKAMGGFAQGRQGDSVDGYFWSPALWLRIA